MLRLLALAAVLAAAVPAHADDCDPTDPAGGTWTSYLAAGIAACEADSGVHGHRPDARECPEARRARLVHRARRDARGDLRGARGGPLD